MLLNKSCETIIFISNCFEQVTGGVINRGKISQFNGLIGMLERGEIDVAVADLTLTYSRNQVSQLSK